MTGQTATARNFGNTESPTTCNINKYELTSEEDYTDISESEADRPQENAPSLKHADYKLSSSIAEIKKYSTRITTSTSYVPENQTETDQNVPRGSNRVDGSSPSSDTHCPVDNDNSSISDVITDSETSDPSTTKASHHSNLEPSSVYVDFRLYQKSPHSNMDQGSSAFNRRRMTKVSIIKRGSDEDESGYIIEGECSQSIRRPEEYQLSSAFNLNFSDNLHKVKRISLSYSHTSEEHTEKSKLHFLDSIMLFCEKNSASITSTIKSILTTIAILFFIWMLFCFADRYSSPTRTTWL